MNRSRRAVSWAVAGASVALFVVAVSARQTVSQGVVTPDNPVFAQGPKPRTG